MFVSVPESFGFSARISVFLKTRGTHQIYSVYSFNNVRFCRKRFQQRVIFLVQIPCTCTFMLWGSMLPVHDDCFLRKTFNHVTKNQWWTKGHMMHQNVSKTEIFSREKYRNIADRQEDVKMGPRWLDYWLMCFCLHSYSAFCVDFSWCING